MHPTNRNWQHRLQSIWPYALLTVVLAAGLIALDRYLASQTLETSAGSAQQYGDHSAAPLPPCGADQLAIAGYSITLTTAINAVHTAQVHLGLGSTDMANEFLPLTSSSPALAANSATQALGLDRMWMVNTAAFGQMSQSALLAELQSTPAVAGAEPIWLQSSDKRYLSCDYKLKGSSADQVLVAIASTALISAGASATTIDDPGTMEFVSLRHFNGRQLLQVAFVHRSFAAPSVVGPSVVYVALLDPSTRAVLATAQANWYLWG
jgi:hypothetical protein